MQEKIYKFKLIRGVWHAAPDGIVHAMKCPLDVKSYISFSKGPLLLREAPFFRLSNLRLNAIYLLDLDACMNFLQKNFKFKILHFKYLLRGLILKNAIVSIATERDIQLGRAVNLLSETLGLALSIDCFKLSNYLISLNFLPVYRINGHIPHGPTALKSGRKGKLLKSQRIRYRYLFVFIKYDLTRLLHDISLYYGIFMNQKINSKRINGHIMKYDAQFTNLILRLIIDKRIQCKIVGSLKKAKSILN